MINFIGNRKIYYIIAAVCMAAICLFAVIFGVPMDIQFKGGSMITYSYTGEISVDEASAVAQSVVGNSNVQESEDVATGIKSVVITVAEAEGITT
ncbi:MAG: protein translocase subunit SecF, partial [Oscillospiraceae bacterium]|nr:protein translocase subunit SecF [Oscillospiraceae bacterium]